MGLPGSPCSPTCRSGVRARYEQRGASGRTRPRFVLVSGMSRLMEQLESTSPARRDERWRPSPAPRRPVELERLGFLGFWFWFSFPPPFFLFFLFSSSLTSGTLVPPWRSRRSRGRRPPLGVEEEGEAAAAAAALPLLLLLLLLILRDSSRSPSSSTLGSSPQSCTSS